MRLSAPLNVCIHSLFTHLLQPPIPMSDLLAPALLEVLKNAVVYKNQYVHLQLIVDEGLTDWKCYIARKDTLFHVQIPEDEMTSKTSITFFVEARGENPEIVFCNHKTRGRSNSISLRSTGNLEN